MRSTRSPRTAHETNVLDLLRLRGRASRGEIERATGLSRATISSITADLLSAGRIVATKRSQAEHRTGRIPELLALNPDAALILGIEFGHARVAIVAANAAHEIVRSETRSHARAAEWGDRMRIVDDLLADMSLEENGPRITAIGIGIPGSIAHRSQVVAAVQAHFAGQYKAPVRLDNNARLAGLAEWHWGAAQTMRDVLYVRLSNGVGGVVIVDGQIHRGRADSAGEFGHVCVDPSGPICRCGNRGCLECYLGLETVLVNAGVPTVDELVEALDRADSRALTVLADAGARLGVVLANACNVLDITSVVLGGDLSRTNDHLVRMVRETMLRHLYGEGAERLQIATANRSDLDGALGAVALVLHDSSVSLSPTSSSTDSDSITHTEGL